MRENQNLYIRDVDPGSKNHHSRAQKVEIQPIDQKIVFHCIIPILKYINKDLFFNINNKNYPKYAKSTDCHTPSQIQNQKFFVLKSSDLNPIW